MVYIELYKNDNLSLADVSDANERLINYLPIEITAHAKQKRIKLY